MSLPMLSGSCWTKRTTESNRTAPEILRGFFCALSASGRIMPHKRSHAAQSADRRPSRNTGTDTDPHAPAAQPAILAAHQLPHSRMALLSKPAPKAKPDTPHAFPSRRRRHAQASYPALYPRRSPTPPIPAQLPSPTPASPKAKPVTPHAFPPHRRRFARPSRPARYPRRSPTPPIPAQLSSPADPYKNPGSRPPPGFFVISGSVRFPSQRRLR